MLTIFDFASYRLYLQAWIEAQRDRGYGLKGQIAEALSVSSSLVSQILKGDKTLTPDQASDLADFVGLNDLESDYFHLLVEWERAGNRRYREKLHKKIVQLREQSQRIGKRVPRQKELTDEQRAIYYSSWLYTGIRNLTAVPEMRTPDEIAKHLQVELVSVKRILRFLIENGLCVEGSEGLSYGPASTHVDRESPFVNKHHQNWRIQAMQKMDAQRERDVFFTSPMSLSKEAAEKIRKILPTVIQNIMKISSPSTSEIAACINIDWFEY